MNTTVERGRAAIARGVGQPLEIVPIEVDPPRVGEVRLRVVATGICHSDLSVWNGTLRSEFPVVLGHEAAGFVESVGEGVSHVEPGDRAIVALTPACGTCEFCGLDKANLCAEMARTMVAGTMLDGTNRLRAEGGPLRQLGGVGSFAEWIVVPAGMVVPIDADLPMDEVCLVGCGVTTGFGAALLTARVDEGATVAVVGCGGVGLSIVQGARVSGASRIVAVDPVESKRTLARELGATDVVDPGAGDPARAVRKLVPGGVHYAFEAVGRPETISGAWGMLRTAGLLVVVGLPSVDAPIPLVAGGFLQEKRVTGSVYGSCLPRRDFPRFLEHYRKGELRLAPMISRKIELEGVGDALAALERGEEARTVILHRERVS